MPGNHVSTTVNGDAVEFLCETEETLLDVLRDRLGLTGTKEGCATGDCGACSVMVDGRLVCSCLVLGVEAEGRDDRDRSRAWPRASELHPLQRKFLEHAALQCGICTPGFLIAAKALLDRNPDPTENRSPLLAGRQSLPLHRLRQDRARRAGRRHRNARSLTMPTRRQARPQARIQRRRHAGRCVPTASTRSPGRAQVRRRRHRCRAC